MFVIFHVNVFVLSNFQITKHLLHFFWKKSFFEMKIFKLVTWYPNMVHMVQIYFNFFWSIFVFLNTQVNSFPQIYSNLTIYKMK
jgi:hypothetical protein